MALMSRLRASSPAIDVVLQRNYGLYTLGSSISLFGMWAHKLAAAWLAWQLTQSSLWVGAVAFCDLLPTVFLAAYAGVMADRYDRRLITLISQFLGMLQAFALGWLMLSGRMTGPEDIWWLLGLTTFLGTVWAFNTAARLSMVPNLVEHRFIPPAIAINSIIFNLARIIGPAIAGFVMVRWGVGEAFIFNGVTYVGFIVTLMMIRQIRTEESRKGTGGAQAQSFEGLSYVRNHPGIGPLLIMLVAFAVGGKSLLELLPEFADDIFLRGTQGLAEMTAAAGIGAVMTSVWLASRRSVEGLTRAVGAATLTIGIAVAGFVATDWFPFALASIALLGGAGVIGATGAQTLMQHAVDGGMRGRVMSLYGVVHRGGPAVGAMAMGAMAELISIRVAVATGAVICFAAWLWFVRRQAAIAEAVEAPRPE